MSDRPSRRGGARRAAGFLPALTLGICLALCPAPALASQPDTDVICGVSESERQDPAADRPDLTARNAILIDDEGTVYFERDADAQVKIASITKVMTALVALDHASLTDEVVVDHAAATVGESSANLREGDRLTMEAALRGLLIASGNDAAMAIATTVGAKIDPESTDPYATFVQAMNDKAAELGMASAFTNPDMHSSARDVAVMFAEAMKNDDFRAITASTDNKISVTGADGAQREITLQMHNDLLGKDGNIGGKTGTTYEALDCLVSAYSRDNGGEIYIVVLGCPDDRFTDTSRLASWYYDHMVAYPAVTTDRATPDGQPLVARATHADWTDKTVDVTVADPEQTVSLFSLAGDVEQDIQLDTVTGDVERGEAVGTLTLSQNGHEMATVELVSAEDQSVPDPVSWLLVQLDRLVRGISGEPTEAEAEVYAVAPSATDLDAA